MLGTNKLAVAGETVTIEKEVMDRFLLEVDSWMEWTIFPVKVFSFYFCCFICV